MESELLIIVWQEGSVLETDFTNLLIFQMLGVIFISLLALFSLSPLINPPLEIAVRERLDLPARFMHDIMFPGLPDVKSFESPNACFAINTGWLVYQTNR